MNKVAQASAEFLIFVAIMVFVMVIFIAIMFQNTVDYNDERRVLKVEDLLDTIQYEFNIARSVRDGYIRNFTIPETLNGIEFEIQTQGNSLIVSSSDYESSKTITNITIRNTIRKGVNTINKTKGIIYLN